MRIPAIVLAAGRSSRMGRPKAALPLDDGQTFLSHIVSALQEAGVSDIIVVVGHDPQAVRASLPRERASPAVRFVENPKYESGQLSSLLAGISAIESDEAPAALVTLVDVPLVSAATIRAVVERYLQTGAPVVRPARGAEHGHPVLIDRRVFADLRGADPAQGAKAVIRRYASAAGEVPVEDAGAFLDIDTVEEYERILQAFRRR